MREGIEPVLGARSETNTRADLSRRAGRRRGPLVVLAIAAGVFKAWGLSAAMHHRPELIALLGALVAFSFLRPRPVLFAASVGGLLAVFLAPHALGTGVGIAFGIFVLLLAVFLGLASVLHARLGRR